MISSVGIVGFGSFGQLLAAEIGKHTTVVVHDKKQDGASLEAVAACPVVIIATDLTGIAPVCEQLRQLVNPETIVLDVCSVKVKPAEIMQQILGGRCRLLATHPLFGPQSAATNGGTKGLKIMLHELAGGPFPEIEALFSNTLGLQILRMTPEEHDKEMAWVHSLTFFVGRALLNMDPPQSALTTNYYDKLMSLVELEKLHSDELFMTIQRGNPFADDIRGRYMASLQNLEQAIIGETS